jgi:hypothetical protein
MEYETLMEQAVRGLPGVLTWLGLPPAGVEPSGDGGPPPDDGGNVPRPPGPDVPPGRRGSPPFPQLEKMAWSAGPRTSSRWSHPLQSPVTMAPAGSSRSGTVPPPSG